MMVYHPLSLTHLSQDLHGHDLHHLVLDVVRGVLIHLLAQPRSKFWTVYVLQLKRLQEVAVCICPNSPQWQTLASQKLNALNNFQQHPPIGSSLPGVPR